MTTQSVSQSRGLPSGEAIAAFMAPAIGLLAMAIANMLQNANDAVFNPLWLQVGSWIPNYKGIGPYSGKETIMFVFWLGSWAILYFALRGKEMRVKPWTIAMVVIVALSAMLFWPPFGEGVLDLLHLG